MKFPYHKKFAFTVIDDTDGATVDNVKPVYDFLHSLGLKTTKTVWVYPSRDDFTGESLTDERYRRFIKILQKQGFEIALHSVGSGRFTRKEIIEGLKIYRREIGLNPKIQINHSQNPDSIYWGFKRFSALRPFWFLERKFVGDNRRSRYFWGDYCQGQIKYLRNLTFPDLNILKSDPWMPYRDNQKPLANYFFSASFAPDVHKFVELTAPENIDRLVEEGGVAIVFTHFASGFVKDEYLDKNFQRSMRYLSSQDGWFAPASVILDFLLRHNYVQQIAFWDKIKLETKWLWKKLI